MGRAKSVNITEFKYCNKINLVKQYLLKHILHNPYFMDRIGSGNINKGSRR